MIDVRALRDQVEAAPADELPGLIGELAALQAVATARLSGSAAPPAPAALEGADLTADQLAVMYQVPKSLFYELARRGELPHVRLGHYVRFRRAEVECWLAENAKTAGLGTRKKRNKDRRINGAATALLPPAAGAKERTA